VLGDIAQLNRRGPYAGHWSLLEQFKKKKEETDNSEGGSKQEGSGTTGVAENGGVKREEGVEEEDTKPDLSDDDLMEMEQIQ
jgi:hypothetical protein